MLSALVIIEVNSQWKSYYKFQAINNIITVLNYNEFFSLRVYIILNGIVKIKLKEEIIANQNY